MNIPDLWRIMIRRALPPARAVKVTSFDLPIEPRNQINKGKLFGRPNGISYHCRKFDTGHPPPIPWGRHPFPLTPLLNNSDGEAMIRAGIFAALGIRRRTQ